MKENKELASSEYQNRIKLIKQGEKDSADSYKWTKKGNNPK